MQLGRLWQSVGAQGLGLLLSLLDRFLLVGILIRAWGTEVYADWAILLAYAGLLALGEFGLNVYWGNALQQCFAAGDVVGFRRIVRLAVACALGLGAMLVCFGLVPLVLASSWVGFSLHALSAPDHVLVLLLLGAATLARAMRGAISQIYRGRRAFAQGVIADLIGPATVLAATIIGVLFLGAGPVTAAGIAAAGEVVGWSVMLYDLKRRWPDLEFRPQRPEMPELAAAGSQLKWLAIQQGAPIAWLNLPVFLLSSVGIPASALVSFILIRTLVNFSRQASTMLSISMGLETAYAVQDGITDAVARQMRAVGKLLSLAATAAAVGIVAFGAPFIELWAGKASLFDARVAVALAVAAALSTPAVPIGMMMTFVSEPRVSALGSIVQLVAGLALCALLAGPLGIVGGVAGLALGEVLGQAIAVPILARGRVPIGLRDYYRNCAGVMLGSAVWLALVATMLRHSFASTSAGEFILMVGIWVVAGILPLLWIVLPAGWVRRRPG